MRLKKIKKKFNIRLMKKREFIKVKNNMVLIVNINIHI